MDFQLASKTRTRTRLQGIASIWLLDAEIYFHKFSSGFLDLWLVMTLTQLLGNAHQIRFPLLKDKVSFTLQLQYPPSLLSVFGSAGFRMVNRELIDDGLRVCG